MSSGSKDLLMRVEREAQAWERRRPEKKFSGLSVTQFKDAAQASRQARQDVKELEASLQGAKKRLKLADAELLKVVRIPPKPAADSDSSRSNIPVHAGPLVRR